MRLIRVLVPCQPSVTTKHRVSLTKLRLRMNPEEVLLRAGSALVRSTLHPPDLGLLHLVMAGLQDFVGRHLLRLSVDLILHKLVRLSLRLQDLVASRNSQGQWVPQVVLPSHLRLEWGPRHPDSKAVRHTFSF
jgi:hypothetical protein